MVCSRSRIGPYHFRYLGLRGLKWIWGNFDIVLTDLDLVMNWRLPLVDLAMDLFILPTKKKQHG